VLSGFSHAYRRSAITESQFGSYIGSSTLRLADRVLDQALHGETPRYL